MLEVPQVDTYRQEVARRLRALRKTAGLSCRQLGERTAMSEAKVSRIETGALPVREEDLAQLLKALECDQTDVDAVMGLARNTATLQMSADTFIMLGNGVLHPQEHSKEIERSCSTEESFYLLVPGMLQTAEYARSILRPTTAHDMTAALMSRLERRRALYDPTKTFRLLLSEASLRFQLLEPNEMRIQYGHMIAMSTLANVSLGIVPFSAHISVPHSVPFHIYDRKVVYIDTAIGTVGTSNSEDVKMCGRWFDELCEVALWEDDARSFLQNLEV